MKLNKKKLGRPLRHVYTEDDYKLVGRYKNYLVNIRRKEEDGIVRYWFYLESKDNIIGIGENYFIVEVTDTDTKWHSSFARELCKKADLHNLKLTTDNDAFLFDVFEVQ